MLEPEITLKQKLNLETAKISWKELEIFFAKGNLLVIEPDMDLIEIATQIATNQQQVVEQLISNKTIRFVVPQWVKENCRPSTELWAVVIAPYVLCQLTE